MSEYKKRTCEKCEEGTWGYEYSQCNYCEVDDCEAQDAPRCPYCFWLIDDWQEDFKFEIGAEAVIECPKCEKRFDSVVEFSYSFCSSKMKIEKVNDAFDGGGE